MEEFTDINILILSEKKVDKSNFIDAFKGYLTFESPEEALLHNKWFNREFKEIKDHVVNLRYEKFCFTNTEGLCGANEPEENKRCLKQVVSHFGKSKHINSIIFLLTPDVRSCKKFFELTFGVFNESALKSRPFMFIFMHDKSSFANQRESTESLKSLLEDMKLNLIDENVWHLNNILRNETCLRDNEDFKSNWNESVVTYKKLFDFLTGQHPQATVRQFADLQSLLRVINNLNPLLYDVTLVLEDNLKMLREIPIKNGENSLHLLTIQSYGSYVTICEGDKCLRKFQTGVNLSRNCHVPCKCPGGNPDTNSCEIFYFRKCGLCQCPIEKHSRVLHTKSSKPYKLDESDAVQPTGSQVKEQYSINSFYGHTTYNMSMMSRRSTKPAAKPRVSEDNKVIKIAPLIGKYELEKDYVLNLLATITAFRKEHKCPYKTFLEEKINEHTSDSSPYKELQVQYNKILSDTLKTPQQIAPITVTNHIRRLFKLEIVGEMISPEFIASFAEPTIKLEVSYDNSEPHSQNGVEKVEGDLENEE